MKNRVLVFIVIISSCMIFINLSAIFHFIHANGFSNEGSVKWKFTLDQNHTASNELALGYDETVYIATSTTPGAGLAKLYAIQSDGVKKWSVDLVDFWSTNPVVSPNGSIYLISGPSLLAYNQTGQKLWENKLTNICSLALGRDGTIYTIQCAPGAYYRQIIAIHPDGKEKWRVNSFTSYPSALTIGKNGDIYYAGNSLVQNQLNGIISLHPQDGSESWRLHLGYADARVSNMAIGQDGSIYASFGYMGKLVAVSPSGSKKWEYSFSGNIGGPSIDKKGNLYVMNQKDGLVCLSNQGVVLWNWKAGPLAGPNYGCSIANDGTIYGNGNYIAPFQNFIATKPDGSPKWRIEAPCNGKAPAIGKDGTIYITGGNQVIALYGSAPLMNSAWPRTLHDNQNTLNPLSSFTEAESGHELKKGSAQLRDWDKTGDSFSFSEGKTCEGCGFNPPYDADFWIADRASDSIIHVHDSPGIIDLGIRNLDSVLEAVSDGYKESEKPIVDHCYIMKTRGKFGKIKITDIRQINGISVYFFNWVFQSNGSRSFKEDVSPKKDTPIQLRAYPGNHKVLLEWDFPEDSSDIMGYYLYRSKKAGEYSSPATDFAIETQSYTDNNVNNGTQYYYICRAVHYDETLSDPSNEVTVLPAVFKPEINLQDNQKTKETSITITGNAGKESSVTVNQKNVQVDENGFFSVTIDLLPGENQITVIIRNKAGDEVTIMRTVIRETNADKIVIVLQIGNAIAKVNGVEKTLDVPPYIESGRTLVPFRFIGESLGAKVDFTKDKETGAVNQVTYELDAIKIVLYIGQNVADVNGTQKELEVPARIVKGRTVVPLRFITENLGCEVKWDNATKSIAITK